MNKKITLPAIIIALSLITFLGKAQNVGIGQIHPASKLDLNGNLTLGGDYSGTGAPTNGAIIEGKVGIGTSSPAQTLELGSTTGSIRIDGLKTGNSYYATSSNSSSGLLFTNFTTGDVYSLQNGSSGQTMTIVSGVPTWQTPSTTATAWQLIGNASITTPSIPATYGTSAIGSGKNWMGTTDANDVVIGTGNVERMRIGGGNVATAGNVGIGTATPAQTLELGSTTGTIRVDALKTGNSYYATSSNSSSGLLLTNFTTGDIYSLQNGSSGQVFTLVSGVPTWSTITAASVSGWALTGNGSTNPASNFIGTTDANDLVFKADGNESMRISNSTGNVVIGSGDGGGAGNIIRAPYQSGGNKTGADFTIAAGAPTGKGGAGNIIFQELAANVGSPGNTSDLSIMAEAMRITNTGALSFGSTGTATGNANNVLISGGSTTNPTWGQLPLNDNTNAVTGTLAVTNGGTGQTTANAALNAFLPSQIGKSGDYLTTNGTNASWSAVQAPITLTTTGTSGAASFSSNTLNIPQYQAAGTYVTGLSVTANQGVSGSFTSGATPALTINLGALTGVTSYNGLVVTANTGVVTTGTWNGTAIAAANGGTGQTSYAIGDILYASTSSALSKLSDVAAGSYLRSGGTATAPVWSTLTLPNAATKGDLLYASATNAIGNLTDVATGNVLISGGVGAAPSWGQVALGSAVSGTLPVANGGTGQTTASGAINALLPSQTGNSGDILTTNGTAASWTSANSGTVTSVTAGQGLTGGTITSSGTIALPYTEYDALLTQSGSSAPTATVAYNNTGGTITWARTATGTYTATISGGPTFVSGSTVAFISNGSPSTALYINSIDYTSTTVLTVNTFTYSFGISATDGGLTKTSVKIQIF